MPTNIDLIKGVAGRVILFGAEREVLDLTAAELKTNGHFDTFDDALACVQRILPSLAPEEVLRLTAPQIGAIYAVGARAVAETEDLFPNADSPTPPSTAAEG